MAATQEQLIAGIAEIIEEVTGIEPSEVTLEKSFVDDLDIDSLSMVEIAVQTEDKYGVKIPRRGPGRSAHRRRRRLVHPEAREREPRGCGCIKAQVEADQN